MLKFFLLYYFLCLSIHLNGYEVRGLIEDETEASFYFTKRTRFSDPNKSYQRISKRIDNLIVILQKGSKVKEESIRDEINDIVNSIMLLKSEKMNSVSSLPVYWYTRQG